MRSFAITLMRLGGSTGAASHSMRAAPLAAACGAVAEPQFADGSRSSIVSKRAAVSTAAVACPSRATLTLYGDSGEAGSATRVDFAPPGVSSSLALAARTVLVSPIQQSQSVVRDLSTLPVL